MYEAIIVTVAGGSILGFIVWLAKYISKREHKLDSVVIGIDDLKKISSDLVKEAVMSKTEQRYQRIGIKALTRAVSDGNGKSKIIDSVIEEDMDEWNRERQTEGLPTLKYKD